MRRRGKRALIFGIPAFLHPGCLGRGLARAGPVHPGRARALRPGLEHVRTAWVIVVTVIVLVFLYPFYQANLFELPIFGGVPERRHRRDDAHLHHDGSRPEHRRRLRRAARPRLCRLLCDGRLHGGLVRVATLSSGHVAHRFGRCEPERARDSPLDVDRPGHRRDLHSHHRRHHRLPDAATARRLSRDRHARLRRDHAPGRPQRRPPLRPATSRMARRGSIRSILRGSGTRCTMRPGFLPTT